MNNEQDLGSGTEEQRQEQRQEHSSNYHVIREQVFDVSRPMSDREVNANLHVIQYHYDEIKMSETTCAISLNLFTEGEYIRQIIVCGHYFSKDGLNNYLKIKNRRNIPCCPLCRKCFIFFNVYRGETNTLHESPLIRNGYGEMQYANGPVYKGEWKNGMYDGNGTYIWNDGTQYTGEWRQNQMCGFGKMMHANGDVYEGTYTFGMKYGYGKMTYSNGDVYEGNWYGGKREGLGTQTQLTTGCFLRKKKIKKTGIWKDNVFCDS